MDVDSGLITLCRLSRTKVAINSSNVRKSVSQEIHELFCRSFIELKRLAYFSDAFPSCRSKGVELDIHTAAVRSNNGVLTVRGLMDRSANCGCGDNAFH